MTTESQRLPRARKRFGQHFLEATWATKVVRAIAPARDDVFLEIGPGRGAITHPLSETAGALLAFEIDRDLAARLRQEADPHLRVVEGDFLRIDRAAIERELDSFAPGARLRAAGNLPYNVAGPILFKLTDLVAAGLPLVDATVMLQREVAIRLLATPGNKDYGVLTILIGRRAQVDRLLNLPPGAFRPMPKIHSTVVRLTFHSPTPEVQDERVFEAMTQAMFTRRRKTLSNALLAYPPCATHPPAEALRIARIDPQRRPETLSLEELGRLSDVLSRLQSGL